MKTRKQWIAMLLMLAMLFTALPLAAFAEETPAEAGVQEEKSTLQEEKNAGEATPKPMQAPGAPSEGEESPAPAKRRIFIKMGYARSKGKSHTYYDTPAQLPEKVANMYKNLSITITDGKTTPYEVPKKFIDARGNDSTERILRDGGEWPVNTELTITIDTTGVEEPYHISWNQKDTDGSEGGIIASGYAEFKIKVMDEPDMYGKSNQPLMIEFGWMDVKFDPQGGNWDGDKEAITRPVKNNNGVDFPENPKKDGLHFAGWYTQFPKEQPVPGQIRVHPDNLGKRVFWTAEKRYSDFDRDGQWFNEKDVDPLYDGIFFLRALWQAHVDFDTDGGSPVDRVEVDENDTLEAPTPPTKSGYRFAGWLDSDGKPYEFDKPVKGDMKLKATWDRIPVPSAEYVDIVFNANEGAWANGETRRVYRRAVDSVISIESAPMREGYKFLYWKGSEFYPGDKYVVPAGGHVFTAMWEKDEKKPEEKPSVDSKIKTPRGSALTAEEIAKILAGTKKVVPAIPRAGVGR